MSSSVGAYSVHAALSRALQVSSTFGQVTTRQQIEGDVSRLVLALPTPSCALTFALNLDLTGATFEFSYGAALTTFFKDANAQYCNAPVYKDTSGALFLQCWQLARWRQYDLIECSHGRARTAQLRLVRERRQHHRGIVPRGQHHMVVSVPTSRTRPIAC